MSNYRNNNNFLLGALMGGIIGGATGLLFAPKKGEDLRCDLADGYNRINDMTRTFTDKAKKLAHLNHNHNGYDEEHSRKNFILGTVAGTLVGAMTAFLLAPKSGSQLRKDLSNKYSEIAEHTHHFANDVNKKTKMFAKNVDHYTGEWKEIASDVLDQITNNLSPSTKNKNQLMDWLNIGVKVLHNLQQRR